MHYKNKFRCNVNALTPLEWNKHLFSFTGVLVSYFPFKLWSFFSAKLGFELRTYTLSHFTSPFLWWVFFRGSVSGTIYQGWLRTRILLIWARITNVSHRRLANFKVLSNILFFLEFQSMLTCRCLPENESGAREKWSRSSFLTTRLQFLTTVMAKVPRNSAGALPCLDTQSSKQPKEELSWYYAI
jgi:hypothetical protein